MKPMLISGCPSRASFAAKRTSQWRTISSRSVNGADERLRSLSDLANETVTDLDPLPQVPRPHAREDFEVRPGGEELLQSAGDHDDADAGVREKCVERHRDLAEHRPVDGVERRAPVLEPGDAVHHARFQELVAHGHLQVDRSGLSVRLTIGRRRRRAG
jgi:hypothetical protein